MSFFFGGPSSQALTSFTAFALITLHKEALSVNRYWLCEVNIPIIPIITLSLFCVWNFGSLELAVSAAISSSSRVYSHAPSIQSHRGKKVV